MTSLQATEYNHQLTTMWETTTTPLTTKITHFLRCHPLIMIVQLDCEQCLQLVVKYTRKCTRLTFEQKGKQRGIIGAQSNKYIITS